MAHKGVSVPKSCQDYASDGEEKTFKKKVLPKYLRICLSHMKRRLKKVLSKYLRIRLSHVNGKRKAHCQRVINQPKNYPRNFDSPNVAFSYIPRNARIIRYYSIN